MRWYAGCHFSTVKEKRVDDFSEGFHGKDSEEFCRCKYESVSSSTGVKLEDFDADQLESDWPFREVVEKLMRLANTTRPNNSSNA